MKTDAMKHLRATKRPHYAGGRDMGVWQDVMEVMSLAAIITNAFMIYVLTDLWSLQATILVEHFLLFLKLAFMIYVDDMPKDVAIKIGIFFSLI